MIRIFSCLSFMCPEGLQLKQIINLIVIDMSFLCISNI